MRLFGSLSELVSVIMRKNSQNITLRPNNATTFTAARTIDTPPQDANSVLVSETATQTLTNKTLTSPAISTPTGITKTDVGLGNVDNTSDATKNAAAVVLTNKDIDGGTASNTSRITIPQAATATLAGLTRKAGTVLYDSTLGVFKGDNGSTLATFAAAVTATPSVAGNTTSYFPIIKSSTNSVSASYTVLDTDGFSTIFVTTAGTNRTITLPLAANNAGRTLYIKKVDSGTGQVIVDGNGTETIDGNLTFTLFLQFDSVTVECDGTAWYVITNAFSRKIQSYSLTVSGLGAGSTVGASTLAYWYRDGQTMVMWGNITKDATPGSGTASVTFLMPTGYTINAAGLPTTGTINAATNRLGSWNIRNNTAKMGQIVPNNTSSLTIARVDTSSGDLQGGDVTASATVTFGPLVIPIVEWAF